VIERRDGIAHLVCPSRPERSLVNAVVYEHAAALEAALPELSAFYDGHGIEAWTVWVHAGDAAAARACEAAGHGLDASPELMWAPLDELDLDGRERVAVDEAPSWDVIGRINDAAYGLPPDHLAPTLRGADSQRGIRAAAGAGGHALACAVVNMVGEDAHLTLVAAVPEARGRGLASACVRSALRRARDWGATSTTLEATQLGRPVYRRMGYRELGPMGMWEQRTPRPEGSGSVREPA
jgi:GNAT superfamily N-acetyltransferase